MTRRAARNAVGVGLNAGALTAALLLSCPRGANAPEALSRDSTTVVHVDAGPAARTERRVMPAPSAAWQVSLPDLGIETLPVAIAAGDGRVYLARANGAVSALLTSTQRLVWSTAPSAMRVEARHLVATSDGRLVVLGGPTDSVIVMDAGSGRIVRRWKSAALLLGGCELADGALWSGSLDSLPMLAFDAAGVLRRSAMLPWRQFESAHPLQRQMVLAGDRSGTCVVALNTGPGFATYRRGKLARTTAYVEQVPTPDAVVAVQNTGPGSRVISSRLKSQNIAAWDAAVMDDVVFVAFQGRSSVAGRVIDRFSAVTGEYLGSLEFATGVRRMAAADGCLYVATYERGNPTLACHRTRALRHR